MLGKFVFIENEEETTIDLDAVLEMGEDLSNEFSRQAANYAYIATLAAKAALLEMEANHQKDVVYAETDKRVRNILNASGNKYTEAVVKAEIELDDEYREVTETQIFYKGQHLLMRSLTTAMEMKANMLISKGAHLRSELSQTDMHINEVKEALRKFKTQEEPKENTYTPPF